MHNILQLFQDQSSLYRNKEIGDGTHDFTKKVLEQVFGLVPKSSLISEANLFGESLYDNFYIYEGSRKQGANARWDFRCKINGQLVVVETEKLDNIEAGMKQIGGYMSAENTQYGIVTDGGIWRFFKDGPDQLDKYETLTIHELCSNTGQAFLQNFYNSYDFYLSRLKAVKSRPFDTQIFHQGLITTAERVVFDLRHMGLFSGEDKNQEKEEIQTAYSLIIQLLLIKIVQDKKKINLLKRERIVHKLEQEDYVGIFEEIESQIKWLGDFYKPYHNQQDQLLNKIITHYQQGSRIAKLNLDSVRLFLDLYNFIYAFDFTEVKQDLFGAVYENYLKELYKDDDTKKGQVFTPPEIVEFMLDEVGYTVAYLQGVINNNLTLLKDNLDDHNFNIDGLSLIDPACGSGTFLYKSAGRIVNAIYNIRKNNLLTDEQAGKIAELLICNNIVGFDIEPFPLYLAEMNILQSLLFFNVSQDGNVVNTIDQPIKIFSTEDSIAEFHNLESSMEKDLQDLIQGGEFATLASKRDPQSILQLKADLQDFDRDVLLQKFQLELYYKALQNEFFIIDDGSLIKTKQKTYRDKHHKKLTSLTDIKSLLAYVRETLDNKYLPIFEKSIKTSKPQLEHIQTKLSEIITKAQTKRTKFDFVVANPPYIAYNSIPNEIRENRKKIGINMNDVFGVGLHSIPGIRKPYSPKPNLYHYFGALSYFLAKQDGKVCFITPEGFVGYDCMCHFLSESVDLQKLYFFNTKVFIERGINGHMDVCTSAIIFSYQKNNSKSNIILKSYSGEDKEKNIEFIMSFMKNNANNKIIKKSFLPKYVATGFSIFKQDLGILTFLDTYKENSQSIEIYYEHNNVNKPVKENFYFDIGYLLDEKQYTKESNGYSLFIGSGKYISLLEYNTYPKNKNIIGLMQANQGYSLLDSKYKIVRNKFMNKGYMFYFEDREIIWATSGRYGIGSDNKEEILYLFGILNSFTTQQVLKSTDTSGEVEAFRVTNQKIKEQIRVPKIDSQAKEQLKAELIANSEAIINLCKNGSTTAQTRGDICETSFDPDSLGEQIVGLKSQYQDIGIQLPEQISPSDPLPDDITTLINEIPTDLSQLEQERDEIVTKLYELD